MTKKDMELLKKEFGSKLEIRKVTNRKYEYEISYNNIIAGNETLSCEYVSDLIKTYSVFGYKK